MLIGKELLDSIQLVANVASSAGILIALAAGVVSLRQYRLQQRLHSEQQYVSTYRDFIMARKVVREYLKDHPNVDIQAFDFIKGDVLSLVHYIKLIAEFAARSSSNAVSDWALITNDLVYIDAVMRPLVELLQDKGPQFQYDVMIPYLIEAAPDSSTRQELQSIKEKLAVVLARPAGIARNAECGRLIISVGQVVETTNNSRGGFKDIKDNRFEGITSTDKLFTDMVMVMEQGSDLQFLQADIAEILVSVNAVRGRLAKRFAIKSLKVSQRSK